MARRIDLLGSALSVWRAWMWTSGGLQSPRTNEELVIDRQEADKVLHDGDDKP
ncbi:1218_t:CDS:2 [Acaulospora colombiana]|uniref:1218_t:CDS:1 n=1 Tax=Acaulospora colombiana TaxID=27376 RepID=A0ACA9P3S7_9GLOM|nr:1218_t:CDS:2 [Acaulospora colombiana]